MITQETEQAAARLTQLAGELHSLARGQELYDICKACGLPENDSPDVIALIDKPKTIEWATLDQCGRVARFLRDVPMSERDEAVTYTARRVARLLRQQCDQPIWLGQFQAEPGFVTMPAEPAPCNKSISDADAVRIRFLWRSDQQAGLRKQIHGSGEWPGGNGLSIRVCKACEAFISAAEQDGRWVRREGDARPFWSE